MPSPRGLWPFALHCYAAPGVAAHCLALQAQGADVCLLLCGLWLERRGVASTPARLAALRAQASAWQAEVVAPLRRLRQAWKPAAAGDESLQALRARLQALELDAERVLLERLERHCAGWVCGEPAATGWLEALLPEGATLGEAPAALRAAGQAAHSLAG